MAARTLSRKSSILTLLEEPSYTFCQLTAHPLAAPYAPLFAALRGEGLQVMLEEIEHTEARLTAQGRVGVAIAALHRAAAKLCKELLLLTDNKTSSPLYKVYFVEDTLSAFKRSRRGSRIAKALAWVESLERSAIPSLRALAPEVSAAASEAEAAVAALEKAQQRMREFRNVGSRRQWVDRLNGTRKETYGKLAKLSHDHPTLSLGFADEFFLHAPVREEGDDDEDEAEETAAGLTARLAALEEEMASLEARRAALAEAGAAAKRAAEQRAEKLARLAEIARASAALEAQRVALEAELEGEEGSGG